MCRLYRSVSGLVAIGLACAWVAAGPAAPAGADETVTVRAGESFSVSLPWTANVKWTAALNGDAAKKVEAKEPGPAPGGKPGGTQNRAYNFKALQPGEVTFTMKKVEVGTNRLLDSVQVTVKIK